MKKINVAVSILVLILWSIANEYFHVAFNGVLFYLMLLIPVECVLSCVMIFEAAIFLFAFIAIFTAIWITFSEDIINFIKKCMENNNKSERQ